MRSVIRRTGAQGGSFRPPHATPTSPPPMCGRARSRRLRTMGQSIEHDHRDRLSRDSPDSSRGERRTRRTPRRCRTVDQQAAISARTGVGIDDPTRNLRFARGLHRELVRSPDRATMDSKRWRIAQGTARWSVGGRVERGAASATQRRGTGTDRHPSGGATARPMSFVVPAMCTAQADVTIRYVGAAGTGA